MKKVEAEKSCAGYQIMLMTLDWLVGLNCPMEVDLKSKAMHLLVSWLFQIGSDQNTNMANSWVELGSYLE
jgi:hypothetical protein